MSKPWGFGVNFSDNGCDRVVAVLVGGDGDIKYGLPWVGPVSTQDEASFGRLEKWAQEQLSQGGYVHLFPAEGLVPAEGIDLLEDEDEDE